MNRVILATALAAIGLTVPVALAQSHGDPARDAHARHKEQGGTVNAMCPVGKEPIVPSAGTIEYKGHQIGLCCPSCGKNFLAWSEERKDQFIVLAMAGTEPGHKNRDRTPAPAEQQPAARADDAEVIRIQLMHYPIDTCIVAGGKLGSMGEPDNYVHEGRLIRFCCAMCEPTFRDDSEEFLATLDVKIIEKQRDGYPLDTCVVSGAKLGSMGDPYEYIHQNRLVLFCCAGCIEGFESDPEAHIATLDKAHADAQRDAYPLDTCVVSGAKLGSMGDPYEIIAGTTLVRFCCGGCLPAFQKDPGAYLSKLQSD